MTHRATRRKRAITWHSEARLRGSCGAKCLPPLPGLRGTLVRCYHSNAATHTMKFITVYIPFIKSHVGSTDEGKSIMIDLTVERCKSLIYLG